jgi:glyoxylase I family protein
MSRIEHVALFTRDLAGLRAFYEQALGLRVVLDNSHATPPGVFLADDRGTAVELIERPADSAAVDTRYVCHIAFLVDDFAAARSALEGRGVAFEDATAIETDSFRTAFFRDPSGNRLQIVWRARPLVSTGG